MSTKKHNAPWTPQDLKRTRAAAKRGLSAREAARELGRTTGAVKYKAMVEGIRFHAIEQPTGVQKRLARARARDNAARNARRRKAAIARRVKPAGVVRIVSAAYT